MRRAILSTKNFNPRLREGGDCLRLLFLNQHLLFQSTPPRGRRHSIITSIFPVRYFNPRLREGGDNAVSASICAACCISIHASAREATVIWRYCNGDPEFQSTPPRGRRRQPVSPSYGCQYISIHASAREATKSTPSGISYSAISIHASAREATGHVYHVKMGVCGISIHASAREATENNLDICVKVAISIHASAREATGV